MSNILRFMEGVRDLAVPNLADIKQRHMALLPKLYWGPWFPLLEYPKRSLEWVMGDRPYGEALYLPAKATEAVLIYSEVFTPPMPKPCGDMIAFVLIHELGHAATQGHGHNSPIWADACREMGIDERVYHEKPSGGNFNFLNKSLLRQIRELPDYPKFDTFYDGVRADG